MFRLLVLATAIVCVVGAPRTLRRERYPKGSRIIGGEMVAIEDIPYQLEIEELGFHLCGAAILSAEWAITSAHCIESEATFLVNVRSGTELRGCGGVVHDSAEIVVNPDYSIFTFEYDVALIRVLQPFDLGPTATPIPVAASAPQGGAPSFVSGWGTTNPDGSLFPRDLQLLEIPIVDSVECNEMYVDYGGIYPSMICAGVEEGGKDFCEGDTGGPLVANGELVGIVSWGIECGLLGFPGVYANVAVMKDWIDQTVGL